MTLTKRLETITKFEKKKKMESVLPYLVWFRNFYHGVKIVSCQKNRVVKYILNKNIKRTVNPLKEK